MEVTKLNRVFDDDSVSILLLCVVQDISAFEIDMKSSLKKWREPTADVHGELLTMKIVPLEVL